jgi:hypothetical protein
VYRCTATLLLAVVLLLAPCASAAAQEAAPREPGSELTVYLATMGPGDAVWEKFGHNAIWIRDATTRTTIAYNYGIFDFYQDRFVPRLMKGDMLYSMGLADADDEVARYAYFNRSVWLQRLNMTAAQKHALREFLEWNWLPQNRDYRYDYFRDNCSTRVRDALDRALGGALRAQLQGVPTGTTYRSHSLRLTAESPATYTGLLLGLGVPTDRPIDAWEESFVPMELMRHVRTVHVPGPNGAMVPLVDEEVTAFDADRSAPPATEPRLWPVYLLIGLLLAGGLLLLARAARTSRYARFGLASAIFFWGLVTGFFGLILAMLWLFTDHNAAYPNLNLLQANPLGLLLAVVAPLALVAGAVRFRRSARLARMTAIAVSALSLLGVVLHMFAALRQQSGGIIALALPIHLATVLSLVRALPPPSSAGVDTAEPPHGTAAI